MNVEQTLNLIEKLIKLFSEQGAIAVESQLSRLQNKFSYYEVDENVIWAGLPNNYRLIMNKDELLVVRREYIEEADKEWIDHKVVKLERKITVTRF